ncbi:TolC family protein [Thermoflavifilum thermophilum]|uniref:Outer membrane protein TolC n=1 Tax=Thermoflavifilum thermophilum TaxID=1393122 RepID=A0A1I7ND22_9BACT|nr:TolC family protein [Thermoflavifilum thermophilum]SFV32456.1 Outer membrane protein TolC [Thermoflavifilum thermophilum]
MYRKSKRFIEWKAVWIPVVLFMYLGFTASAQDTLHLSLQQAIELGLQNSKQLKISRARVQQALLQYQQAKDAMLPSAKISYGASEAFIPTKQLVFGRDTLHLPGTSRLYLGTLSIQEPIFAGNQLRYARQSAEILEKIASLDTSNYRNQITNAIIQTYGSLLKIIGNQKVVAQNIEDVQQRLIETRHFEEQGLATQNDVLRFQLQLSDVQLTALDLENNRKIVNYNLNILLGLPDTTEIMPDSLPEAFSLQPMETYLQMALQNRKDLQAFQYRLQLNDLQIRKEKDSRLPTLGVGVSGYYINPNNDFFPPKNTYLAPVTVGLTLGWSISSLYTAPHRIAEAQVQKTETQLQQSLLTDQIKEEIHQQYRNYQLAMQRIKVLQVALAQAEENDRMMESKYRNQLASTTDRIDAETLLFKARVDLQLAQVDAVLAYYQLLASTGTLSQ